jgi:hypothetical protein
MKEVTHMATESYDTALERAKAARTCPLRHYCERHQFIMNNLFHGTESKYDVVVDHTNDPEWDDPRDVTERVFSSDFLNEAEAYIAQHAPTGKVNVNGVCKVCDMYDRRQKALKEGRVLPYYIVASGISRHYGGPEEGGWWYDWTEILGVRRAFTLEEGLRAVRALREEYPQPRYGRHSCANRGEPDTHITLCYGEDDPRWPTESTQRPRYE